MAVRRVYFAFHYKPDIHRVHTVTNSWLTKPDRAAAGFFDASIREEAKSKTDQALRKLISEGLDNTSVTAVLIGTETASRQWVRFEISESIDRGNALLGIRIHGIRNLQKLTSPRGPSPFQGWEWSGKPLDLSKVPIYDWVNDNGYQNMGHWIQAAYTVPRQ